MLRADTWENNKKRRAISFSNQRNTPTDFSVSTTTGATRWGMVLKDTSSTRLGSTMMNWQSSGVLCMSRQAMTAFSITVLPLPVAPAIRRWGIFDRSAATDSPPAPLPRLIAISERALTFWNEAVSITLRRVTVPVVVLGTSMPTTDLPGTGASILMVGAASASDRSLARDAMRSTLTLVRDTSSCLITTLPSSSLSLMSFILRSQPGSTPNWVTAGPTFISTTLASTP